MGKKGQIDLTSQDQRIARTYSLVDETIKRAYRYRDDIEHTLSVLTQQAVAKSHRDDAGIWYDAFEILRLLLRFTRYTARERNRVLELLAKLSIVGGDDNEDCGKS